MQKKYRLTNRSSFQYIFKKGEKIAGKFLVLYKVNASNIKVGISVSKKVGNSVVRSKVKRRIKESFRLLIEKIKGNYNFVVVARKECNQASFQEIQNEIDDLLKKNNVEFLEEQ